MAVKESIGQLLTLRHSGTGEQVLCRVAYISPHQSEKREVGLDFMKPCPGFGAFPFLHQIGQSEVLKRKVARNLAAPGKIQKPRLESRDRFRE